MVCGLVWGIGLGRLGCVCGRRLGTGSCVSVRQTTTMVVRGFSGRARAFLSTLLPLTSMSVWSLCLCLSSLLKLALREAGAQVTR